MNLKSGARFVTTKSVLDLTSGSCPLLHLSAAAANSGVAGRSVRLTSSYRSSSSPDGVQAVTGRTKFREGVWRQPLFPVALTHYICYRTQGRCLIENATRRGD